MSSDIYADITARIVAALEAGTPPWVRPWSAAGSTLPVNATTHRPYRGINVLLLAMEAVAHGYTDSRWLTFRQATTVGGRVRKGEHGTTVVFWKLREIGETTEPMESMADTACRRVVPLLRCFTVFNVAQVDGLPPALTPALPFAPAWQCREEAEAIIDHSGAEVRHGGGRAYYQPAADFIQLPPRAAFTDASSYYATALHELVHWTGHPARLKRQLAGRFGDDAYAAEELVAELGAAFLCAHCRLDGELQHASYVGSWLRVLKQDKRAIFVASTKAQHAADFLLGQVTDRTDTSVLAVA
ncbi:MAG: zincin-like metallopeptidase domain-containing protein [Burkholderiales bacterium]